MDFLSFQAKLRPSEEALSDLTSGRAWSYQALDSFVARLVTWIEEQGVSKGDRIVCLAKNCAETIAVHIACGRAGVMFVPLNWRLADEELKQLLNDCEPALLVGDSQADRADMPYTLLDSLSDATASLEPSLLSAENAKAPSLILYTSGTTGLPKGIVHNEVSVMETAHNLGLLGHVDERSVFLCESPMFHVIGLISCIRPALYAGGRVIISDGFEPGRTFARLSDPALGVTHYFCVPQMANAIRQVPEFDASRLTSLKALLTGGAPHPEVQIRAWLKDGIPIVDGFGMSETGTVLGMSFDKAIIDAKAGSVGIATPRVEVRLVGPGDEPVKVGEAGEIQVRGDNLYMDVWKNRRAYERTFTRDGWFQTGDIGVADEDGYIRIVDRMKDMFISGGENVYPAEVEAAALHSSFILECAMIGVPDEKWGEVGCLFVVARGEVSDETGEVIRQELATHIAKYKIPKYVRFIDELPRTGAGKVRKNILKSELLKAFEPTLA